MALDDPNYDDTTLATVGSATEGPNLVPPAISPNYSPPPAGIGNMDRRPVTHQASAAGQLAATPSYPVFVDPIGWQGNAANRAQQLWLAGAFPIQLPTNNGNRLGLIPRRPLYVPDPVRPGHPWVQLGPTGPAGSSLREVQRILSQFTLVDDLSFNYDGTPDLDNDPSTGAAVDGAKAAALPVQRQGRYSWAYLVRRLHNDDSNRARASVSVVVYSGRSVDVPSNEAAYLGAIVQTSPGVYDLKQVTLTYASKPTVRRGGWVLDATLFDASGNVYPQGFFYRVVNVDDSVPGQVTLELQTPLRATATWAMPAETATRVIVVLDNVVEVFQKEDVEPNSVSSPY
jgi:hypothetical protein